MAASSLVVRISADLNDFSRNLKKMTKDVRDASKTITDIGKDMTLGITLPVTLAGLALSKMAMENEAVGAKMDRSFGPAAERMNAQLQRMMKLVPETETDLQLMAITVNDFAKGLGMAAPKAAMLSASVMQLAANIAASKPGVEMPEALDAVEKGLMGQTRSLKALGIVLDENEIKQTAYAMGLMKSGQALTPLGQALATYAILVKKNSELQSETNKVHMEAGRQWKFLKRDIMEVADSTSNLLLPALRLLIGIGRAVISVFAAIPDSVKSVIMIVATMAAVMGPTIIIVAKLTEAITVLRTALLLLGEGSAIKKALGFLLSPQGFLAMAAVAALLAGITIAWQKFHKATQEPIDVADPLADIKDLLGGITGSNTGDPMQQYKKNVDSLVTAYQRAVAVGSDFKALLDELKTKQYELSAKIVETSAQKGATAELREQLNLYKQMYDTVSQLTSLGRAVMNPAMIGFASKAMKSDQAIQFDLVGQQVNEETALRTREAALAMADVFNATRVASIEMREQFRDVARDFAKARESFKGQWKDAGASATAGLMAGFEGVLMALTPFALALKAIGAVMQGLQPFIDALFVPLEILGQIIGTMLTPYLKILFAVLKPVIIIVSFLGEVISRISAGIATGIGKLLVGLGNLINKLPGSPGNGIKAAGEAMLGFAKDQYAAADQMKRIRKDLGSLSFEEAKDGIDALGDAARDTAEALTNLPDIFKYKLAKYTVQDYRDGYAPPKVVQPSQQYPTSGFVRPGDTPDSIPSNTVVAQINLDSKRVAQLTWGHVRAAANAQFGNPTRVADVAIIR